MATSTVTTSSDIPKVLESFYLGKDDAPGLIQRGIEAIYPAGMTGKEAYDYIYGDLATAGPGGTSLMGAGSIAPLSQFQNIVGEELLGLQLPGDFGYAREAGQVAGAGLEDLLGTQALSITAPELIQYQMYAPEMFSGEVAQRYMSPYMQNVVDIEQRQAIDAARRAQLGQNLSAARQGTYGGARQTLLQGERESGLRSQLGDIQARGLQAAYEQAQQQFERDRAAQMGVSTKNLEALLGVQSLGAGQTLEAERLNQAAGLDAARLRRESATGLTDLARTMGGLGQAQLGGELDILRSKAAFGDLQRANLQDQIDASRRELINRAEYGRSQVGDVSNLLRGVPLSDTTQRTVSPAPSTLSQYLGTAAVLKGGYDLANKP